MVKNTAFRFFECCQLYVFNFFNYVFQDNKSIQIQVKKKTELNLLRKDPKFTSATKGNILNSKSDILILTWRLQLKEILSKNELTTSQ